MPEPAQSSPFRCAVLGLNGGPTDDLVVRLGCTLAKPHKAQLTALHVVEVDWRHDLDEDISSANEQASAILDRAEGMGERMGIPVAGQLLQARDVGAAIVDESSELGADLIIVGLPYRKKFGGDFAMGATVPYVLQNAGCGVLVVREPIAAAQQQGR